MSRQSTRGGKSVIVKCFTAFHADFGVQLENPQGCHYKAGAIDFPRLLWTTTMNVAPNYFYSKIEPKETPSCLIPCLLVVFTQQLEILVTSVIQDHWDKITWWDSGCPSSKTYHLQNMLLKFHSCSIFPFMVNRPYWTALTTMEKNKHTAQNMILQQSNLCLTDWSTRTRKNTASQTH